MASLGTEAPGASKVCSCSVAKAELKLHLDKPSGRNAGIGTGHATPALLCQKIPLYCLCALPSQAWAWLT